MDLGSSTARVGIGPMPSPKKKNKSSFAIEKVRATGAGGRDTEGLAEVVAEKVSTLAVVTDRHRHVSIL